MTKDPTAIKPDDPVRMKISGDGAKFSKSSNIILLSFSFPGFQQTALSGAGKQLYVAKPHHTMLCVLLTENVIGNHTFAAINAQENYDTLSSDMNDVMKSINNLVAKPEIEIGDKIYTLDIIMGSDYKVCGLVCIFFNAHHSSVVSRVL